MTILWIFTAVLGLFFVFGLASNGDKSKQIRTQHQKSFNQTAERRKAFKDAAAMTLELVSGLSENKRSRIIALYGHIGAGCGFERDTDFAKLQSIVGKSCIAWQEWDYWQPICESQGLFSNGMRIYCRPNDAAIGEHRPELELLKLLGYTIRCRADILFNTRMHQAFSWASRISYDFPFDQKLAELAASPKNPWRYELAPRFPGGLAFAAIDN